MFKVLTFLCALAHFAFFTTAHAQGLKAGFFVNDGGQDRLQLSLKDLPGRSGSFIAILMNGGKAAVPYLVDEFAANKYGFIPLYNQNNLIGARSYVPSLSATVGFEDGKTRINLTPNAGNAVGFTASMKLKFESLKTPWARPMIGSYKLGADRKAAKLTPQDANGEYQLSITAGTLGGDYVLREVRPGLFIAFKSKMDERGIETVESSNWIVYFLSGSGQDSQMVFLDTNSWGLQTFIFN